MNISDDINFESFDCSFESNTLDNIQNESNLNFYKNECL